MSDFSMMTSRLRAQLNRDTGLQDLDKVVEKYGRIGGEPFSFDGHEFQREIIRDTRSRISVRKCSQVGLSELMVQKLMALCSVLNHERLIFTLPVAAMAAKFSKDRIDGLIEQSDYYRGMVVKANNSASQKKIGSNTLYIGGTFGDTGAISVPAGIVISDEIDFSNQDILGKLSSRLRHAKKDERGYAGKRFEFSTPTVDDYGVDERFQRGNQMFYAVKCKHCSEWHVPDFFEDFVVPGLDKAIVELTPTEVKMDRYRFHDAWIRCPGCHNDLWESLIDPTRRQWIAKYPDRWEHSYQVFPWDVPTHNTPASIIRQMGEYRTYQDFCNFVVGLPFTSPDNSFILTEDHKQRVATAELWIYERHIVRSGTVIGMDVGKVCHLTVMAQSGSKSFVVWSEEIQNTINDPATEQVLKRYDFFRCVKMCVDAGPDITLVNQLVAARGVGGITAVQYVRSVPGLDIFSEHDNGELIKADRTQTLSELMRRHNAGEVHYPIEQVDDVWAMLKNIKKIRSLDVSGDDVERFEKTGPDHWAHSLNYANIARMAVQQGSWEPEVAMPPTVGKLRIGSRSKRS